MKLIKERDKARIEASRGNRLDRFILVQKYKTARNRVTRRIRKESQQAFIDNLKKSSSPSELWREVKPKSQGQGMVLKENGEVITDEKEIAEKMNPFFKEKIEKIANDIPTTGISPTDKLEQHLRGRKLNFSLHTVTENQVNKAIRSLKSKTSSGVDFVSSAVIKMSADIITTPLTNIINSSIAEGVFPDSWKIAKIIPIWKRKGSKTDKTNYRPVSLLRSASKVLELIVNQQVLRYFEKENLLPPSQHGFRPSRSTFTAIAQMHDMWMKNYKEGKSTIITCYDLSAAFDTLDSSIFCSKLKLYGFDQKSREWFKSYLSLRRQVVMIGASISSELTTNIGSPQGAILSPTIFIILTADIGLWSESKIFSYADDTTSTLSGSNMNILIKKCEEEALKILDFMSTNRLKANDDKTAILISKRGKEDSNPAVQNVTTNSEQNHSAAQHVTTNVEQNHSAAQHATTNSERNHLAAQHVTSNAERNHSAAQHVATNSEGIHSAAQDVATNSEQNHSVVQSVTRSPVSSQSEAVNVTDQSEPNLSAAQNAARNSSQEQVEQKVVIQIGNERIEESSSEKLLGVHIKKNFKWEKHIDELERKLRFRLFSLRRLSERIPKKLLKTVADGIFMSQIRYALPLFCPLKIDASDPTPGSINKIRVVFNDCLRLLTGVKPTEHRTIKSMLEEVGWLSINQMCAQTRLMEAWKSINLENYCMSDNLKVRQKGAYKTRSSDLVLLDHGEDGVHTSFVNPTSKIWNKAARDLKQAETLDQAKKSIRKYVIEKVPQ